MSDIIEKKFKGTGTVISIFTEKGGVGKTTFTYHLSCILRDKYKKKVLIIDSDPQNNICHFMHSPTLIKFLKEKEGYMDITDIVKGRVYKEGKYIRPLFIYKGINIIMGGDIDPNQNTKYEAMIKQISDSSRMNSNKVENNIKSLSSNSSQVHFSESVFQDSTLESFYENIKIFKDLYDYILIDMSPSYGAINQTILLCSDEIISLITPTNISYTSIFRLLDTMDQLNYHRKAANLSAITINVILTMVGFRKDNPEKVYDKYIEKLDNAMIANGRLTKIKKIGLLPIVKSFDRFLNDRCPSSNDPSVNNAVQFYIKKVNECFDGRTKELCHKTDISGYWSLFTDKIDVTCFENPKFLYIMKKVDDSGKSFWKIGVSMNPLKRMKQHDPKNLYKVEEIVVFVGEESIVDLIEQRIKVDLKSMKYSNKDEEFLSNKISDSVMDLLLNEDYVFDYALEFV